MIKRAYAIVVVAVLIGAGVASFLAYHYLSALKPSKPINVGEKLSNVTYKVAVLSASSLWGPNPPTKRGEDIASLVVLVLYSGSSPPKVSWNLSELGIEVIPSFGWAYKGNVYVGNLSAPPRGNPPILEYVIYNKIYQRIAIWRPGNLSVIPGKPFGVIMTYVHYPSGNKTPPPLDNLTFKASLQKVSPEKYWLWLSIYSNGIYVGKVPVLLEITQQKAVKKEMIEKAAKEVSYSNASIVRTYSWEGLNPATNTIEVRDSLIVALLSNGHVNTSKVRYTLNELGILPSSTDGWVYVGDTVTFSQPNPKFLKEVFTNSRYQKVVVYYPEKLTVKPGKPFGVILRYIQFRTGNNTPLPLENITYKLSLHKISSVEYKLWISIYVNGNYLGKVPVLLALKP